MDDFQARLTYDQLDCIQKDRNEYFVFTMDGKRHLISRTTFDMAYKVMASRHWNQYQIDCNLDGSCFMITWINKDL